MTSRKKQVFHYTKRRIEALAQQRDASSGKAALAQLRRGIGRTPGELPEVWGLFLSGLPEDMMSPTGKPSREEWAIYTALTLWALHQQGQEQSMHRESVSLGQAAAELMESLDDQERVWKRLNIVALSADMQELAYHLRGLVQLLKAQSIPLDYALLAEELYEFQVPQAVDQVRLRWGQAFFLTIAQRFHKKNENDTNDEEETNDDEQ